MVANRWQGRLGWLAGVLALWALLVAGGIVQSAPLEEPLSADTLAGRSFNGDG